MRVLLVTIRHQVDSHSGSARIAHDESVALVRRGHEVWVLAEAIGPAYKEHEIDEGRHLLRYRAKNYATWHPKRRTAHQKATTEILKRYLPEVDLIHGHIPLAYKAALDLYSNGARKCYTVHSPVKPEMELVYESAGFFRRLTAGQAVSRLNDIEAECLKNSDLCTALSQFTVDCLGKIHGPKIASKVVVLPGWADTKKFQPLVEIDAARRRLGWRTDIPTLFTLRRFTPRMGLDRLIAAAGNLKKAGLDFRLVLAGDGPLRNSLQKQVSALGLDNCVSFVGKVSEEELPLMYGACDAFVLPTRSLECFGLIAIEALSAGRPVLATPVGAIPEVLRNFEPAWMADSASVEGITDLLRKFLNGELPRHAPEELHKKVETLYARDNIVEQLIETVEGNRADARGL